MPVVPNIIENLVFLRLNKGPVPIIEAVGSGALRALDQALRLGVFEALDVSSLTVVELATKTKTSERGMKVLLEALRAFRYVKKKEDRYSNTAITSKWLLASSPSNVATWAVKLQRLQQQFWDEYFEDALRQGEPPLTIYEWLDKRPGQTKVAQTGFMELAHQSARIVTEKVKLPSPARRLLDVGGGHGLYSIEFCRRHSNLSATVFDFPSSLEVATENIASERIGDRVLVQPGNFWEDDLGSGYDVALLFNVIHGSQPDRIPSLLKKVGDALKPGGQIVIMDVLGGVPGRAAKAFFAYFALTFFITLGGQIYSFEQVYQWLRTAGLLSLGGSDHSHYSFRLSFWPRNLAEHSCWVRSDFGKRDCRETP